VQRSSANDTTHIAAAGCTSDRHLPRRGGLHDPRPGLVPSDLPVGTRDTRDEPGGSGLEASATSSRILAGWRLVSGGQQLGDERGTLMRGCGFVLGSRLRCICAGDDLALAMVLLYALLSCRESGRDMGEACSSMSIRVT
jgi:hypothetical protein